MLQLRRLYVLCIKKGQAKKPYIYRIRCVFDDCVNHVRHVTRGKLAPAAVTCDSQLRDGAAFAATGVLGKMSLLLA